MGRAQGPNASFHRLYDRVPRPTASRDVQRAVPLGLLTRPVRADRPSGEARRSWLF